MSAPTMEALAPFLADNVMLRVSLVHRLYSDTGLGVILWATGARTSLGLHFLAGEPHHCLNESTFVERSDPPERVCLGVHMAGRPEAFKAQLLQRASLRPRGRADGVLTPISLSRDLCEQSGGGRRGYAELTSREEAARSIAVRDYLQDCLLLLPE